MFLYITSREQHPIYYCHFAIALSFLQFRTWLGQFNSYLRC